MYTRHFRIFFGTVIFCLSLITIAIFIFRDKANQQPTEPPARYSATMDVSEDGMYYCFYDKESDFSKCFPRVSLAIYPVKNSLFDIKFFTEEDGQGKIIIFTVSQKNLEASLKKSIQIGMKLIDELSQKKFEYTLKALGRY